MGSIPPEPRIYHITHVDNLPSIISDGVLWSDAELIRRGGPAASIGMGEIKARRLELPVKCHPGDLVGDYVPFYYCPRSIMLYVIHCGNHANLQYRGGQGPILHLEFDLHEVVEWANGDGRRWAISFSNAGAAYAEFSARLGDLGRIDWNAVATTDFRTQEVKEGKQAEFLVRDSVPIRLVRRIGVHSMAVRDRVIRAFAGIANRPSVEVLREWYY